MSGGIIAAIVGVLGVIGSGLLAWWHTRQVATAEQRGRITGIEETHAKWVRASTEEAARDAAIATDAAGDADAAQRAIEDRAKATLGEPITDKALAQIIARSKGRPPP